MPFRLTEYFGVQELLGVLVPGVVGVALMYYLLRDTAWVAQFQTLPQLAQWVLFGISGLILGWLAYPAAHIFNVLYDRTYRRWRKAKVAALYDYAKREADARVTNISQTGSVYEWARTRVEAEDRSLASKLGGIQGVSKLFRTLCLFLVVATGIALWRGPGELALILAVLLVVSFLVFAERRLAATCLVYQRLMDIAETQRAPSRLVLP